MDIIHVFIYFSQDGADPNVKSKALSYDQLTYMQVHDR